MKSIILLGVFISVAVAFSIDPDWKIEPAIVGGSAAPPHAYPFMAAIHWVVIDPIFTLHVCGGALLNRRWVLTAAHCLTEIPAQNRLDVILGNHDNRVRESGQIRVTINRTASIVHPDWVPGGEVGPEDMALLYMFDNIEYSTTIQPIRLSVRNTIPTGTAIAAGWGSMRFDAQGSANVLQHTQLTYIDVQTCRSLINGLGLNGNAVDYTNVCTGPRPGVAICSGDSGGPLFQRQGTAFVLQGIVSWGITPCGLTNGPSGVFKRVSAYIDWIAQHTGIRQ